MSNVIDNRIVEMQFNNSQFQNGVQSSIDSINNLNKSLKFENAGKGFENINAAARRTDLSPLSNGIDLVSMKFRILEGSIIHVFENLIDRAMATGKKIVDAFTVDSIKAGFQEYETQIGAIQTILANTQSKGTTLDDVTKALDELNHYADMTIYNFTEMTKNIGRFTASGVDLETSVSAIQGIANLAAVSGSTSQQASTAMYQLSQALSSGYVKLQDWNSVVNAGMGGMVFQEALKDTSRRMQSLGKDLDKLNDDELKNLGYTREQVEAYKKYNANVDDIIKKRGSFRESLRDGWINSDILAETLKGFTTEGVNQQLAAMTGYDLGLIQAMQKNALSADSLQNGYEQMAKKLAESGKVTEKQAYDMLMMAKNAEDAATKVKTFTQLVDTMKEAAQSGWTKSFEYIIGDFEEAKKLWSSISDYFNDVIGKSSDARNNILLTWKESSGRNMLISSGKNIWEGLVTVLSAVKDAFKEVFPPITGRDLINITRNVAHLSFQFKQLALEYAPLLKEYLAKGLSIIKGLFDSVSGAGSKFKEVITSVVDILKSVGSDIYSSLSDGLEKLSIDLGWVKDAISDFVSLIKSYISGLKTAVSNTNFFQDVISKVVDILSNLIGVAHKVFDALKQRIKIPAAEDFTKTLTTLWDFISNVANKIIDVIFGLGEALGTAITSNELTALLDNINGVISTGSLLTFTSLISGLSNALLNVGTGISTFSQGAGQIPAKFNAFITQITSTLKSLQNGINSEVLKNIATSVGILAGSLFLLSLVDPARLIAAGGAVTGLIGELMAVIIGLQELTPVFSKASSMVTVLAGIAGSIFILSLSLLILSNIDMAGITKGLVAMLGMLYESMVALIVGSNVGKFAGIGNALVKLAVSMLILAVAMRILSKLNWEQVGVGLTSIGGALTGMVTALNLLKGSAGGAAALLIASVALIVLAKAMQEFAKLDWNSLPIALLALGGSLLMLALALNYMQSTIPGAIALLIASAALVVLGYALNSFAQLDWDSLPIVLLALGGSLLTLAFALNYMVSAIPGALALLIASAALLVLSEALKTFAGFSWEQLAVSLLALVGSLTAIAVALYFMTGAIGGAFALLVASAAIYILAAALDRIASIDIIDILKGLLAIAVTLGIMALAGYLLTGALPGILGVAGALFLIGAAVGAVGVGLGLAAIGISLLITTIVTSATGLVAAIIIIVNGVISLVPVIVEKLAELLNLLIDLLIGIVPKIGELIKVLVEAAVDALVMAVPVIVDGLLKILDAVLQSLIDYFPDIVVKLLTLLSDLISKVFSFLSENIPKWADAGTDMITEFLDAMSESMVRNAPLLRESIINFFESLSTALSLLIFGEENRIRDFFDGIKEKLSSFWESVKEFFSNIGDKGKSFKNSTTSFFSNIKTKVSTFFNTIKSFISNGINTIVTTITNAKTKITNTIDAFKNIGKNIIDGLKEGIKSKAVSIVGEVVGVLQSVVKAVKNLLGIHSPSRVFREIGRYVDEGFANGIYDYAYMIDNSANYISDTAMDSITDSISSISDLFSSDLSNSPTIRPILDLSDVTKKSKELNDIFADDPSIGLSTSAGSINSLMNASSNGSLTNADIISAINSLAENLSGKNGDTYNINGVTYDDGSNISYVVKELVRAARVERRV